MVRISNAVVGFLNIVFLLIGLLAVAGLIVTHVYAPAVTATTCQHFVQNSLLIVGAVVAVVSLLGMIGSCCKNNVLLGLYLIFTFLIIVGLIVFAIFVFVVTNEHAGKVVSGMGIMDHRLGDYSHWLQNHFAKGKNWDVMKSCMADSQICKVFDNNKDLHRQLSSIQSGCCEPPSDCGFKRTNATFWRVPKSGPAAVDDSDCSTWNNDPKQKCYNCNSCKAGFLANTRKQWRNLAIYSIVLILFAIIVFSIGCCAKRNNSIDKLYRYRSYA